MQVCLHESSHRREECEGADPRSECKSVYMRAAIVREEYEGADPGSECRSV